MTMVDDIAVLAFNDETGRNRAAHLGMVLAASALAELVLQERIDVDTSGRINVVSAVPTRDHVLDELLQRLGRDRPRKAKSLVRRLSRGLKRTVLPALVERRVLTHERGSVLGLFPLNRYRPADPRRTADLRSGLAEVAAGQPVADARTAALVGIVWGGGMYKAAMPGHGRLATGKVFKAFVKGPSVSEAARQVSTGLRKAISDANAAAANAGGGGGG